MNLVDKVDRSVDNSLWECLRGSMFYTIIRGVGNSVSYPVRQSVRVIVDSPYEWSLYFDINKYDFKN